MLKEEREGAARENASLRKAAENLRLGPKGADAEVARLNAELAKLNETVGYMFKRTKSLSTTISKFFEEHCTDAAYLNVTQEYVLSYESSIVKLDDLNATGTRRNSSADVAIQS